MFSRKKELELLVAHLVISLIMLIKVALILVSFCFFGEGEDP